MRFLFFLFVFLVFTVTGAEQKSEFRFTKAALDDYVMTLGYLSGQEYSATYTADKYPDLKPQITAATNRFNFKFEGAKENLIKRCESIWGKGGYEVFEKNTLTEMGKKYEDIDITRDEAMSFLNTLKARSEGKVESPFLETLLLAKYQDNPEREYLDGFTKEFISDKSESPIKFKIKYPASWKEKPPRRPHVIRLFTSENGRSFCGALVMIRDVPIDLDIKELNKDDAKEILGDDVNLISFKHIKLDSLDGVIAEYELLKKNTMEGNFFCRHCSL